MKGILRNWHRYLLWAVVSCMLWAWIFTLVTDAPAGKKLVLYADLPAMERDALAAELEKDLPAHIRFVEAWVFMDEMFNPSQIGSGDMFILSESQVDQYLLTFSPLDEAAFPGCAFYRVEGTAYGVCVYDEAAGIRVGTKYLAYEPGQTYYLFFNAKSGHIVPWNDAGDDAALRAARTLLTLE